MIKGIGVDMVRISRMEHNVRKEHFLQRVFTEQELVECKEFPARLAGNFAIKEAVVKMFGTGFRGVMPIDIEVLRDELGCPYVRLYNGAVKLQELRGIKTIFVSLTNEGEYVCGIAVGEGE